MSKKKAKVYSFTSPFRDEVGIIVAPSIEKAQKKAISYKFTYDEIAEWKEFRGLYVQTMEPISFTLVFITEKGKIDAALFFHECLHLAYGLLEWRGIGTNDEEMITTMHENVAKLAIEAMPRNILRL